MKNELKGFSFACNYEELKEEEGKRFIIDDEEIALFKVKEKIYALNNFCPHQHAPLIYDGFIENVKVVCPAHGWEFDLETGKMHTGGGGLKTYEVKIHEKKIFVKVVKKEWDW